MSISAFLNISITQDNSGGYKHENVSLSQSGIYDLYEFLLPRIRQIDEEYTDEIEGIYFGGAVAIFSLPTEYFQTVYTLILQACDEIESLKPYKAALKAALEADPRYRQTAI